MIPKLLEDGPEEVGLSHSFCGRIFSCLWLVFFPIHQEIYFCEELEKGLCELVWRSFSW